MWKQHADVFAQPRDTMAAAAAVADNDDVDACFRSQRFHLVESERYVHILLTLKLPYVSDNYGPLQKKGNKRR